MKHTWRKTENGKIDTFASSAEYCNGPVCERCGFSFCEHCNPEGYDDESCPSDDELLRIRAKLYKDRVLSALRDDGKLSLSFKDVETLSINELKALLPLASAYAAWLLEIRDRAKSVFSDEIGFVEQADKITELYERLTGFCKDLGVE